MKILLHLVHATDAVRPLYEAAIRARGIEADVVTVLPPAAAGGQMSSSYADMCIAWGLDGLTPLQGLLRDYPGPSGTYQGWFLASWSAGYKLVERALYSRHAEALVGAVMLDSGHAAFDGDGTPADRQLEPFVDLARRAAAGEGLLWVAHTDVQTPQRGPGAFASTTQWAAELVRLAKPAAPGPLFRIEAFNREPPERAKQEHIGALLAWGPSFVGDAIAAWIRETSARDSLAGVAFDKIRKGVEAGSEGLDP